MKDFAESALGILLGAAVVVAVLLGGIFALTENVRSSTTERITACVASGGDWTPVQLQGSCVHQSDKVVLGS